MPDEIKTNRKRVSYSQYSMYSKCPQQYYLNYIAGKRIYEASLNMCFGTAIHHAIQEFITALYTKGQVEADSMDVYKLFKDKFKEETEKAKTKDGLTFTEDEYKEFEYDGDDILNTFLATSNRIKHFPSNRYEFIGVELPLEMDIKYNVQFVAFVDLILKDKRSGKIKIFDFKTSSNGWNKWQLADTAKTDQVLLYKAFYSKKFNVPLSDITVEFFILKRKLYEDVKYPQSRIQVFSPSHTKDSIISTLNEFTSFVESCFTEDGNFNVNGKFPKIAGKNYKNCKYCSHKNVNCFPTKKDQIIEE